MPPSENHAPKGAVHAYHKAVDHTPAAHCAVSTCFSFPDFPALLLFIAAVLLQMKVAYSLHKVNHTPDDDGEDEMTTRERFRALTQVSVAFAIVVSFVFINIMLKIGGGFIKCAAFTVPGLLVVLGVACLFIDQLNQDPLEGWYFAAPISAIGLLAGFYFYMNMADLEFAGACLETASLVISRNPATEFVAIFMVLLQAGWSIVFATCMAGAKAFITEDPYQPVSNFYSAVPLLSNVNFSFLGTYSSPALPVDKIWLVFSIVLTFFWGQQVLKNIVVYTTAGTTAEWWFNRYSMKHPTWDAFVRACTTGLGTIAFGSLLVAILEAICYMITQTKKYIEKYANETVKKILCLVFIVLKCLQKCLEIFNFYVYVVSGIYGYGFCQSAGHVLGIFMTKGMLLAEEGTLVSLVLLLGKGCVTVSTGALAAVAVSMFPDLLEGVPCEAGAAFGIGASIGWGISLVAFGVIETANATVFICYIENPHALHDDHPESYEKLNKAWVGMGRTEVEHDYAEKYELLGDSENNAKDGKYGAVSTTVTKK